MFHVNPSEVKPMSPEMSPEEVANHPDLTLDNFIQWMETHPPTERYWFLASTGGCLMGQYMKARGLPWGRGLYGPTCKKVLGYEQEGPVLAWGEQTFGAALKRAKALREQCYV